ncbi:hypothetical protein Z947_3577 [Sulfitobacter geojensis]|nr:hypothetical protein Z947_3577 [Sulfitobacter geojensis]
MGAYRRSHSCLSLRRQQQALGASTHCGQSLGLAIFRLFGLGAFFHQAIRLSDGA